MARLGVLLILLLLVKLSVQTPTLTIIELSVELQEEEAQRTQIPEGGGAVLTCVDTDGDQTRAYIASISPTSGCGLSCLQLLPQSAGSNDWGLWYMPSEGELKYLDTIVYELTVVCTDDKETPLTRTISVTIVANSPPAFDGATDTVTINGQSTTNVANTDIYPDDNTAVKAVDPEGDPLTYIMSTVPITDLLEIERKSGQIRAAQDLKMLCVGQVEVSVWTRDQYNAAVGPFVLDITIDNYNTPPVVTNLDTTITIDENIGTEKRILQPDLATYDTQNVDFTYHMWSTSSAGMDAYFMRGDSLRTGSFSDPDYEREDTRSTKLYFQFDDQYCRSDIYSLTVDINDLPEEPKVTHTYQLIWVDEGWINVPNNIFILDDDFNEVHTWSRESDTNENFDVDPVSGDIFSFSEFYLAPGRTYKDYTVKTKVTDKDGLQSGQIDIYVRVFDVNDQKPYFTNTNPMTVAAHECLPAGSVIGSVTGADDDSIYNLNNFIYFGGGGGKFTVAANGWVILTEVCSNGETFSGTATIADQGINPGPLTGDPLDIDLICGPCPAASSDDDANNSTASSDAASGSGGGGDDGGSSISMTTWLAPTVIGFSAWLGLTAVFCSRFCRSPSPGSESIPGPKQVRVSPQPPKGANPYPPSNKVQSLPPSKPPQPQASPPPRYPSPLPFVY